MKVKIYWEKNNKNSLSLLTKINNILEDLWLNSFIEIENTYDEALKNELNITKEPALIIIEESIDFKDIIFEWIIPSDDELKSMFISIIWWGNNWASCDWTSSGCSSCSGC